MVTGIKNADENGLYNGVNYSNYQNVSKTEKVKVGSHQEDQGHYEEYVDYQYCSICGAKKQIKVIRQYFDHCRIFNINILNS